MKLKKQTGMSIKKVCGETFIFKNGLAKVPGCTFQKKPMMITYTELVEAVMEVESEGCKNDQQTVKENP